MTNSLSLSPTHTGTQLKSSCLSLTQSIHTVIYILSFIMMQLHDISVTAWLSWSVLHSESKYCVCMFVFTSVFLWQSQTSSYPKVGRHECEVNVNKIPASHLSGFCGTADRPSKRYLMNSSRLQALLFTYGDAWQQLCHKQTLLQRSQFIVDEPHEQILRYV